MTQQVPVGGNARADAGEGEDGSHQIAHDLAYCRTIIANVVFYGMPQAGDRNWVLIDAGVIGGKSIIRRVAEARFGAGARPSAIVMTHGHFDHVGALEDLAAEWDVPVYAHPVEHPYLNGQAAYPPGDPSVGGGLIASLSALYPTRPVNVAARLQVLPEDGNVPGMPGWKWLFTSGHSPGHISLWRQSDRALIAGDAFVTTAAESVYATAVQTPELHGPPRYFTINWGKARSSVKALAALDPEIVVTGHGRAMRGAEMNQALHRLAADFTRLAVPEQGRYLDHPVTAEDGTAYFKP